MLRSVGPDHVQAQVHMLIILSNFAANIGINFKSPEEFFLGESPQPFTRDFEPTKYLNDGHESLGQYLRVYLISAFGPIR